MNDRVPFADWPLDPPHEKRLYGQDINAYGFDQNPDKPKGIGDINSDAKGSGARYNDGKVDLSLIPLCTLEDEACVWMYGKAKYKAFNWMKGMNWSIPLACALRHLSAWQRGEQIDPESGLPHLAHVMCNIRMLTLYEKIYPEGDDRPPQEFMP
jgi:hypothetical protein